YGMALQTVGGNQIQTPTAMVARPASPASSVSRPATGRPARRHVSSAIDVAISASTYHGRFAPCSAPSTSAHRAVSRNWHQNRTTDAATASRNISDVRSALAAVDRDRGTGDPARARRRQERDDVTDFLGATESSHGNLACDEGGHAFGVFLLPLPPGSAFEEDRSGRDAVDADVVLRQ